MASKFESGFSADVNANPAERVGERELDPRAAEFGKAALAAILKQSGMSLSELIKNGAKIEMPDGGSFDVSQFAGDSKVVDTGERVVGSDGETYRKVNMFEVVDPNAPEAKNAAEINAGTIKAEKGAEESSEKREISEDEYYSEHALKVLPISCFKKFSGQLGLSNELLQKGFKGMAEWPLEAKKKYFELAKEANPDANYDDAANKHVAKEGLNYTVENAKAEDEQEDAESGENKERFIAKMRRLGHNALKALSQRIGIKPFKEWNPTTQKWVKRMGVLAGVAAIGLTLSANLRKNPEKMAPGFDTFISEEANADDVEDTLATFETNGTTTAAVESREQNENKEAIPAKTNWEASTYMHRGADGKLSPDVVISADENGNFNDAEGKRSKWNIASLPEYTAKFAAENGLDANDLETKKMAFKSLVKEGPEYTAMFLYNAREEGCEGCDIYKGNPESIKVALQQSEKAREEAAKLVDKIIDGSAITEDVLKTGRYFNSYFAEQEDGVHIIEQGVDAEYYQLNDGESDNAKVFKLSYTDEHGETKAFYVKQVCGQLVREGAWFKHEETPVVTTDITTTASTTALTTESTLTTSTSETTTSTETTTSAETTTNETSTSTSTSTTESTPTTTSTSETTTPATTTEKVTTKPVTTTEQVTTTKPATTTEQVTTTKPATTTEKVTTKPVTTTEQVTTTKPETTPVTTTTVETKFTTTPVSTTTQPVETSTTPTYIVTTAPVTSTPEKVSSGPATGDTETITTTTETNLAKEYGNGINFDMIPGGEEDAYEPDGNTDWSYATSETEALRPEDIRDYQDTDAEGNSTVDDWRPEEQKEEDKKNELGEQAELIAQQDPYNHSGEDSYVGAPEFIWQPPEFDESDDANNIEI